MAYTPYVKVAGTWQKVTINWTEVIGGPTDLIDLTETSDSRHLTDTMIASYVTLANTQTFTGIKVGLASTAYTTRQLRNVIISTASASGGSNGDIWVKYTA